MNNNLINNKKQQSYVPYFDDLLEYIQTNMDVMKELEHDINIEMQEISKIAGKEPSDFIAGSAPKMEFWENLIRNLSPEIYFVTRSQDNVCFFVKIEFDEDNKIKSKTLEKWITKDKEFEKRDSAYNFETKQWEKISGFDVLAEISNRKILTDVKKA